MQTDAAERQILWCFHGNLQQPTVWNNLTQQLQENLVATEIRKENLWGSLADSCWSWAERFCQATYSVAIKHTAEHSIPQQCLLGYSLGGRLALHALVARPELWSKAIIIGAGVGTTDPEQKQRYLGCDRIWAHRFLTEPWDDLLREWDNLPVFCGRPCPTPRPESDFDRHKIAHAFEAYSKGRMDYLVPRLAQLSIPITYVTGSDDHRYCQMGQTLMNQCPTVNHVIVENAGHRVPWEQPQKFAEILSKALGA